MIVLVTGGRTFKERDRVYAALDRLETILPGGITGILEGGACGADYLARCWGERECIPVTTVHADWNRQGKAAGPIRNRKMADMKPDVVLACPGGDGTADMVAVAKERGIQVVLLEKLAPRTLAA